MRYLHGTATRDLNFRFKTTSDIQLHLYTDASFADSKGYKSTSGILKRLNDFTIVFKSKIQPLVATSTFESELISLYTGFLYLEHICGILEELRITFLPPIAFCDTEADVKCLSSDQNPRRKHLGVRYHKLKEAVDNKKLTIKWIFTEENLADVYTKSLPAARFNALTQVITNDF